MGVPLLAFLLFGAFETVQGLISPHSKPTSPAENQPDGVNGWTPRTTTPPRLHGNGLYGAMTMHELFKRGSSSLTADLATCGWYNADGDTPLTCDASYACAYLTKTSPQWFACCTTKDNEVDWSNCPYYSICYPYDSYSAPNTWTGSYEYAPDGTTSFFCPSNLPYCNTIFLTDQVSSTYQHMYCDTTQLDWTVLQYVASTSGSSSGSAPTSSAAPISVPHQPSAKTVTVTKSKPGGGTGLGQNGGSSTSATASPTGKSKKSNTNVGAIAGGVVGGVAGLALIGAGVGYLIYRKRKARVEPMREVSIYSQNYPNSNGGVSSGYNNGNNY